MEADHSSATADELRRMDAYWRAANYLSIGQIYLMDNPLLREPLRREHIKPRLLGHWGTTPGLNFVYVHLNRVIKARDLDVIYVAGPGHGGPGIVANTWLEGTYSEVYPNIPESEAGMKRLFTQFSFPGGIPSHVAPETPGSIHEGGELGYSLLHAYGAAFDNPDLLVCCVVGDGEAETGALAASWHSNKFLNPATGRRRAADPAPQRLQDRQPHRPGPHRRRGAGAAPDRLRLQALHRRRPRAGGDASSDGRDAGRGPRRDRGHPGLGPRRRFYPPAALAADRAEVAQGLDRPEDRGRPAGRGHVPGAPGAARRGLQPIRSISGCSRNG